MFDVIDVLEARHVIGTVVELRFSDGVVRQLDLRPIMRGPAFDAIFEADAFEDFVVDSESGTLVWPNGADISPETLRYAGVAVRADAPPEIQAIELEFHRFFSSAPSGNRAWRPTGSPQRATRMPFDPKQFAAVS
ncbi:hypothetical protein PlfCFBP13513_09820 [Plantibacter flavus]|uniref:DUF2442 domain-containing protein n=1 Tax=Plantibacter flavus TaxID=150123 RepID=UPI0010C15F0C|nr:DUF2442 domain-containing protein [Plantibacter flavus]TKJ99641.1 hypothetical protein PlfCFBP13513_09820 [Plantibacter flavus]